MNEPQRILVIETLYLGDLIHTLPLIQALRRRYPAAQIDVLVRAPHVGLMQYVQGVSQVLCYEPRQHRGLRGIWSLCRQLRDQCYDLVLNPGASDRASVFTAFSGGQQRLGRLNRKQSKYLWPLLHDQVLDRAWGAEPMYWQKLMAFKPVLGLADAVQFGLDFSAIDVSKLGLPARYIHISPFASEDIRCLPLSTLLELLSLLRQTLPQQAIVVSCGPAARETERLSAVQSELDALGVITFKGILQLPQLGALVQAAALHIGPDSGPLHLAAAVGTATVACFLFKDASAEWMPLGVLHRCFGVTAKLEGGLYGLPLQQIVQQAAKLCVAQPDGIS